MWVEPVTGVIVKGQEVQHQVFRDAAGADAVTLVDVTLTFNEKTQKQQADLAKDGRSKKALLGTWAPLALILLGVILLIVGLVILARRDDGAAARHAAAAAATRSPSRPARRRRSRCRAPAGRAAGSTPPRSGRCRPATRARRRPPGAGRRP